MIIGIGLPRTGTRSLGNALEILGYRGSHHCELIGTTKISTKDDSYYIDNSIYHDVINTSKDDIYIMTYRPPEEWRGSIFKFKQYDGPDIEHYKKDCIKIFKEKGIKFLIFNIIEGWEPLCNFLNHPIPSEEFPTIS
jgi:hypothetical protein